MTPIGSQARNVLRSMHRLVYSPVNARRAAVALGRGALLSLVLCAVVAPVARADCFRVPDAAYTTLDRQVDRNATQTLSAVAKDLRTLERSGSPADSRQLAALYAVQAN